MQNYSQVFLLFKHLYKTVTICRGEEETHTLPGVHPEFLNGGTDAEVMYNLCLILKILL